MSRYGSRAHFLITFILLFYRLRGRASSANILSNKEILLIIFNMWLVLRSRHTLLLIMLHKSHLLMIWWSKHLLVLCFLGQFGWEYLRLDIHIRLDVRDWQSNALMHHFGVQVLALDLLLPLS